MSLVVGVAAALLQAGGGPLQGAWRVTCDVAASPVQQEPRQPRVFRLAPRTLQEWSPVSKDFGPNLCGVFVCTTDGGRLEGTITTASMILTIAADPAARQATWRIKGASASGRSSGACTMEPERSQPNAAPPGE
ncbi:hypothetical protein [Phenylobacterium sp. LjRoot219]|uniref:hypothetical protein n=1 Tax=Phenylobacterium sp. LjRoot219 TaxID=3342283 RepID=UPI003F4F7D57